MLHGWIPPERYFAYRSWLELQNLPDRANTVIIQPMGAIEQHGHHLPLAVDAVITAGVLGHALAALDPAIPAFALPPLYYGKSNEHWRFPGTITLTATTLTHVLMDVGHSLFQAGFRKLILLNGHGGQPQVLEIVARDLHQQYADFWVFPHFVWSVPHCAADLLTPKELAEGIHAGDAETSLLLALLPDQVDMSQAIAEYPPVLAATSPLSLEGALPISWATHDLSRSGVIGDPTTASRAKGLQLLDSLAQGWVEVFQAVHTFHWPEPESSAST